MSLRPEELTLIAAELDRELSGGVVQKVYAPTTTRVYLEVRVPGRSEQLLVCSDPGLARISAITERPSNPPTPPSWQSVLRRDLTGAKLIDAEALPARKTLLLHFTKDTRHLTLVLEATTAPLIALCTKDAKVLAMSTPTRPGVRIGQPWAPLEEQPIKPAPSRLMGDHVSLRLAHAAEALLATAEQKTWVDARRAPLLSKLKKIERTKEKVRVEAERTGKAHELRRAGELLAQNLYLVKRGQKSVTLTEYLEDGSTHEVEVELDPKRTPQQEVEWRFHQYKRMLRGAEMAKSRLVTLEAESAALQAQLTALDTAPPEPPALGAPRVKAGPQPALPPYREYLGHGGHRIWVGRGSSHNDDLTFHVAKPFHVWLHVRGLPGSHVVIPIEKNTEVSGELLLDAATLAAHHSDAKGEPRVEVSYVPAKFVRKPKDAAPGAVTYTREKTLLLRLETNRLQRLLATCV
ncbi:MAG: NFACT RNA binding domain-containing protein [Archangium sp.]|nr:NFACT RNA binding domain-containing protein [Archangium sp.]MDP3576092.1 NFACT RNA binding domain-containing protein [Archangium sp.]